MKRQNNTTRLTLATAGLLVVAACSGSTSTDSTTDPTTIPVTAAPTTEPVSVSGAAEVDIVNFSFNDAVTVVKIGDTVTWTNSESGIPHTSTADDGLWASGALDSGDVFEFTFTEPGTYTYFCSIHPSMTGSITVSE